MTQQEGKYFSLPTKEMGEALRAAHGVADHEYVMHFCGCGQFLFGSYVEPGESYEIKSTVPRWCYRCGRGKKPDQAS